MTHQQTARLILILGGARSGKSTLAERLAAGSGKRVAFIATGTASDEDMQDRIARHRASRPAEWTTIEEPLDLVHALKEACTVADVILLDCLTLWLANWIGQQKFASTLDDVSLKNNLTESALAAIDALLAIVKILGAEKIVIIVSNEVGLGIVPMHPFSRAYRDTLGWVNQRIAQAAERVYLMVAGLAVDIKKLDDEIIL